jgi:hypothetical protein
MVFVAACMLSQAAYAEWVVEAAAGGAYNTNLTRAQDAPDRRPDHASAFSSSITRYEVLSGYDTVAFGVGVRGEIYRRYQGLNFVGVGASASYRRKLMLGLTAPYVLVNAAVSHDNYREDVRDSNRLDVGIELGKRFDEATAIAGGLLFDHRHALTDIPIVPGMSGAIFELRGCGGFLRVEHALDARWQFGARAAVRRGDVESTSQRSRAVFTASDAVADDPAFEDPLLFGYRLRGTTVTLDVNVAYVLSDRSALTIGYVEERTDAANGLEYRSRILAVTFNHRF